MTIVLDTDAVIHYLHGEPGHVDLVAKLPELVVTSFTVGELYYGALKSKSKKHLKEVYDLVNSARIIDFRSIDAFKFGELKAMLSGKGRIIGDIDMAIAAICITNQATLVTRNLKHYQHISQLKLQRV
ncbi:type II toxin-antitoxin system VapC family toxin [Candidatus Altiarchaeota archaeon]